MSPDVHATAGPSGRAILRLAAPRRGATAPPEADQPDERGAVLLLALILLVVGTIAIGALAFQVTNDLSNSKQFQHVRSVQFAAKSATNLAIQNIRYTPMLRTTSSTQSTLNASPPVPCWGSAAESSLASIDGVPSMASWCTTSWTPSSGVTRTVTISTCPATESADQCADQPLLQAIVTFDDYPAGAVSGPTASQCQTYCGTSMVASSWVWSPVLPTVTAISPTTGPITGGTPVTITGTGFVAGSTVSFIEESGGTPAANNEVVVVPAASVTVNSPTSISAIAPAITEGSTYFVEVTTNKGANADGPATVFTYTPVAPVVSSISPTTGSIAGGTSVTVTGSAFMAGAVVRFVQESGGTVVPGGATLPGTYVHVASSTSLTVVSPGVITGTTYFVTVHTASGTSSTGPTDVFTYSPLVPTVSAISPNSGPNAGGTQVTITGTGFVLGATVSFVSQASGCGGFSVPASNVTVVNSSTITASTPSISFRGAPYYAYVTTASGPSSCYPVFTYTG